MTESREQFTVMGARGFIGRHVADRLRGGDAEIFMPERDSPELFRQPLGHLIYCAGVTSDFRKRPFDTVRAHTGLIGELLDKAEFQSLLYLSSTRIYLGGTAGSEEAPLTVNPHHPDHLFHLSKLAGESLCLHSGRENVRIARLSNVCGDDYGSGNFLYALLEEAVSKKRITLRTSMDSAKDYISVEDAADLLIRIARNGQRQVYNVASGVNVTNSSIVSWIQEKTACDIQVMEDAKPVIFPDICIDRIRDEFGYTPPSGKDMIGQVVDEYLRGGRGWE
jgi:nucleoside-diphosphate-sugar epimerase